MQKKYYLCTRVHQTRQNNTIQPYTILYNTIQPYTILYNTIQYYTILTHSKQYNHGRRKENTIS